MRSAISKELQKTFGVKHPNINFAEHHLSHAALAYKTSGFEDADILIVDAVGEWATTSALTAKGNKIEVKQEQHFPDSLGMLYSAFTQFLGFKVNSDEYKVMGLAPYGDAESARTKLFIAAIENQLTEDWNEGFLKLHLPYFRYHYSDSMIVQDKWEKVFGIRPRQYGEQIEQHHADLAYAIQHVLEKAITDIATGMARNRTSDNLCLSGGVALNCAANGRLLKSDSGYRSIHVPFAPGDCGCSVGAALAYSMLNDERIDTDICPYLGPQFSDSTILSVLKKHSLTFVKYQGEEELLDETCRLIADNKIIGWFQGRMEMGPRALGNRSILADARNPEMKDWVNSRIKFREAFRPFAPSIPEDDSAEYFDNNTASPYMMFTFKSKTEMLPSVTHIDGTSRIQTVTLKSNPRYYRLLKTFKERTGCPVLLNTSFNIMGEPIVCSPEDAVTTFNKSGLDYLVIGNYIVKKI